MIRILIADDHVIVRSGLKQLLGLAPDINVCGEAVNGAEVLEMLRTGSFDLLLMDMTMPGISGVDLVARVRSHFARQPVLVLSMHNEPQVAMRALKAGANGYLTKDSDPEKLLAAIRKVAAGGRYIDPDLAAEMAFEAVSVDAKAPHAQLSDREYEIFRMVAKGKGLNEIADQLAISNKTVSTHKTRVLDKMGFSSTAELIRYAVENKIV